MTIDEVGRQYMIPRKILEEYESWGGCGAVKKVMGDWKYDEQDLERLSLIMTLHDIGFEKEEIEAYMTLMIGEKDNGDDRLRMLQKKRLALLDEIYFREKKLEHLDYLRHEIGKMKNEKKDV